MSTISLRLPTSLHDGLREVARKEGVSINQLITSAVAEKLAALETERYLAHRAERGRRDLFEAALSKVADRAPDDDDER
jgi:predicted DNA-binding ribbon-helix-helix protein